MFSLYYLRLIRKTLDERIDTVKRLEWVDEADDEVDEEALLGTWHLNHSDGVLLVAVLLLLLLDEMTTRLLVFLLVVATTAIIIIITL